MTTKKGEGPTANGRALFTRLCVRRRTARRRSASTLPAPTRHFSQADAKAVSWQYAVSVAHRQILRNLRVSPPGGWMGSSRAGSTQAGCRRAGVGSR